MSTTRLKCFGKALEIMRGQPGNPYEYSRKEDMVSDYMPVAALDKYKSYIRYSMVASGEEKGNKPDEPIRVELVFEKGGDDARVWNLKKMGILRQYEKEIETAFSSAVNIIWKSKRGREGKDGIAQKIVIENVDIKEGLQESNIDEAARWLADNMLKLARAVQPYANELKTE